MRTRNTHVNTSAASPKSALRRSLTAAARRTGFALALGACFLSTHKAQAADTWIGNATANFNAVNGFNVVPTSGDTLQFGPAGAAGTTLNDNLAAGFNIAALIFNTNSSAYTIGGNSLTLSSGITDSALNAQTINNALVLSANQTFNVANMDGTLNVNGISGAYTLTKTGAGLLSLGSTATFSNLVVQGGTVQAGGDNNLGASGGSITLDGGTLRTNFGNNNFTYNIGSNRAVKLGDAGAGTGGTIDTGGGTSAFVGVLSNNGGTNSFTKTGSGTLQLGGTSTYTGATNINQGQITLDFNSYSSITSNFINSASTLVMGGPSTVLGAVADGNLPSLYVQGTGAGVRSQTFSGLTLNAGTSQIAARAVGSNNVTVALGVITHNAGGIAAFTTLQENSSGTGLGIITTTNTNDASGILGGWAVTNAANSNGSGFSTPTDYATVNGSNQIVAYTGYTTQAAGAITSNTLNNDRVTAAGGVTLTVGTGTTDINTLSNASTATGTTTVNIASDGILRVGANGGFLTAGGSGGAFNISGGTLTAGGAANTAGTINLIGGNGGYTISSAIADNGTGAVSVVLSQFNNSTGVLSGNNTYSGGTYFNDGRTQVNSNTALGTGTVTIGSDAQAYLNYSGTLANAFNIIGQSSGNNDTNSAIRFQGGQTLSGTITMLGDSQIAVRGSTGNVISGKITGNGNLTIGEGNGGGDITFSNTSNDFGGKLNINNESVILGASGVIPDASPVDFTNGGAKLILNGFNETIGGILNDGGNNTALFQATENGSNKVSTLTDAQDFSSTFNGILRNSSGGSGNVLSFVKSGLGTLTLAPTYGLSAYTGGTTINGGAIRLGISSTSSSSAIGAQTGALAVNSGGTLDLGGFNQTVGALSGTAGGVITDSSPTASTITFGDATALTAFAGSIQDGTASGGGVVSVTKQGSGTTDLTGANTYSGATSITTGALQIGSGGSIAASNPVTLSGTASLILGDGTGAVSQTLNSLTGSAGTSVVGGNATTASTLTLNGAGTVAYANAFGGSTATSKNLNLVIAGTGTTPTSTLSGTSTYTGTTTINSGSNLQLTGSLGNTAVTVSSGGTLSGTGNGTSTGLIGGTVNAVGGSTVTLATPGTVLKSTGAVTLGTAGTYNAADYSNIIYTLGGSNTTEALNTAGALTANNAYINIFNPTLTGTYTLANYASLTAGYDFSLSSTAGNVLTQNLGRNSETLTVGANALTLLITGAGAPNVAYFNGGAQVGSKTTWNNLSDPNHVNFSTDLAGNNDAGNVPGATSDVILNAANATTKVGTSAITETLGASTIINSLNVNGNGTTTLGADGSTLTLNAVGDANTDTGGGYTGNTVGTAINVMSGANAFTVNVPLVLGTTNAQSYTNASGSTFTVNGTVTGNGSVDTLTLANTSTGATAVTGAIANGAGGTLALAVNNTGTGATTLSGANTYSGGTTLTAGALQLSGSGTLGSTSGALTVNGGTLDFGGTSQAVGSLTGTGGTILNSVSGAQTLTVGTGNATGGAYAGVIEDNAGTGGTLSLIKTGTGTETLSGADAYSGGTTVNQGTLTSAVAGGFGTGFVTVNPTSATASANDNATLNTTGSIASTAVVTVNSETSDGGFGIGTINFNSAAPTIGSLAGNGKVVLNNAAGTNLTVGNASSTTFSGVISNGAGAGSLTKAGTDTLTLTGTNTYTGGTTVNAGTLATTDDVNAFGTNGTGTTVAIGSAGTVNIISGANNTYSDTFSGSGKLLFTLNSGGGDTVANNFNAFNGTLELSNPTGSGNKLQINTAYGVGGALSGATLQIDSGAQYFTGANETFGTINVVGTGNSEGRGAIRLNGNGTTSGVIGGNVVLQGNTTIGNEGGVLTGNISTGVTGTSTLTMGTGNSNGTAGLSGNISNGVGTLALNQSNGTTTLSGTDTYTGATTVTGGTLSLTGSLTGSNVSTSGGAVVTESAAGVIGGTGTTFTQGSTGTSILAGANTYTGGTTVTNGILRTSGVGTLGATTGGLTVNGGTLDLNGTSQTVANLIGTGGTILNSAASTASTLTFGGDNANNSFNGTIEDNSGTGGTLAVVKQGTGVESFGGTVSNTGGFTVGNGVAYLTNGNNPGAGALTFGTAGAANNTALVFSQGGRTFSNAITTVGTGGTNTIQSQGGGQGFTFSGGATLGNNLTFRTVGGSDSLNETGAITGTGNVETNVSTTSVNSATSASGTGGTITLSGSINNIGTITNDGTGSSSATLSGTIGSNVTSVIENSATSTLNYQTSTLSGTLQDLNGLVNAGGGYFTNSIGAGTVTLGTAGAANSTGIYFSVFGRTFNNQIVTQGTGGTNTIQAAGGGQGFTLAGGATLGNNLTLQTYGGSDSINETGAIGGTGNLVTNVSTSSIDGTTGNGSGGTITLSGNVNNTGTITNSGAGTSATTISGVIGSNVTGVAQNSATSALILTNNDTIGGSLSAVSGATLSLNSGAINTVNVTGAGTDLTLAADTLNFDVSGSSADKIAATGLASIGGSNIIDLTSLAAFNGSTDTLISAAGGLNTGGTFTLGTVNGTAYSAGNVINGYKLSLNDTGGLLQLVETANLVTNGSAAYFTGTQGTDFNANNAGATNFVTTPTGGTAAAPGAATNVFFTANTATNYGAATVSAPTTINSLNLGTGAASGGGTSISGSTLTINAAGTGGNTAGSGITDSSAPTGAATTAADTVASNVTLGNSQTVTVTNAPTTLTVSGTVSDGGNGPATLTKAGAGGLILSSSGNSYTGGTIVNGGTLGLRGTAADGSGGLTITNSTVTVNTTTTGTGTNNGSALGAGGVTLNGGTLANANLTATSAADAQGSVATASPTNNFQNGGILTLTSGTTSVIDFGASNKGAVFSFTSLTFTGSTDNTVLDVLNFDGNFNDGTHGGHGLDQLIFGNSLSAAQLADIMFVNPYDAQNKIQYSGSFKASQLSSDGEVSPAPEPSQYGMMGLMTFGLGGLILRAKKRQAKKTAA